MITRQFRDKIGAHRTNQIRTFGKSYDYELKIVFTRLRGDSYYK